jgi:hypothetical protein
MNEILAALLLPLTRTTCELPNFVSDSVVAKQNKGINFVIIVQSESLNRLSVGRFFQKFSH